MDNEYEIKVWMLSHWDNHLYHDEFDAAQMVAFAAETFGIDLGLENEDYHAMYEWASDLAGFIDGWLGIPTLGTNE